MQVKSFLSFVILFTLAGKLILNQKKTTN